MSTTLQVIPQQRIKIAQEACVEGEEALEYLIHEMSLNHCGTYRDAIHAIHRSLIAVKLMLDGLVVDDE